MSTLSKREIQVVFLAGRGLSDKDIARKLQGAEGKPISPRTISNTLSRAYRKLQAVDRFDAARVLSRDYSEHPTLMALRRDPAMSGSVFVSGDPPPGRYRPPPTGFVNTTAIIGAFAVLGALLVCVAIIAFGMAQLRGG